MFKFSGSKCPCPHCRGGHNLNVEPPLEEYADAEDGDTEVVFTPEGEGIALVTFTEEEASEHALHTVNSILEKLADVETEDEAKAVLISMYGPIFNYGYSVALRNSAIDILQILQQMQDEGKI